MLLATCFQATVANGCLTLQGRGYTAQQLQEMLEWCVEKGVHLISDEVWLQPSRQSVASHRCAILLPCGHRLSAPR